MKQAKDKEREKKEQDTRAQRRQRGLDKAGWKVSQIKVPDFEYGNLAALRCLRPIQKLEREGGNDDGDSGVNEPAVFGPAKTAATAVRVGARVAARAEAPVSTLVKIAM